MLNIERLIIPFSLPLVLFKTDERKTLRNNPEKQKDRCEEGMLALKEKLSFVPTEHLEVHMNSLKRVCAFQIEWEFASVGFKERGKPEYPEKNLSKQGREPATNSARIWRRRQDSNSGHIGERQITSPPFLLKHQV